MVVLVLTQAFGGVCGSCGGGDDGGRAKTDKKSEMGVRAQNKDSSLRKEFLAFRRTYITVYLIIMLADWMQGTHMYTLYLSYGVSVSTLFITGFLSGAIFAPFLGSAVDKFGRKRSCVVYCVLEIIINTLEHYDNMTILLIGRVLGGISTNLLFSAFESWMATHHRSHGFPEQWLGEIYAASSVGNGAMAILAGILAQLLEDSFGHIGPFQGAIALTALALVVVMLTFEENYGEDKKESSKEAGSIGGGVYEQFILGWKTTCQNSTVWRIGLTQALSEGAMYTFVFMWVPTLLSLNPPEGRLPTGCVFASFMMAITMGGVLFPVLQQKLGDTVAPRGYASEVTAAVIYGLSSLSMAVPAWYLGHAGGKGRDCFKYVLASFVVVEVCVGVFMPVAGTLRSKYVPDALQGAILNIFRLPLNVFVVLGTRATDVIEPHKVFTLVGAWFLSATIIQASMIGCKSNVESRGVGKRAKME